MMTTALRPILVTGAHRTGTTWVGRMLADNQQTAYISEPLNVLHRPGVLGVKVAHWYTYICAANESDYLESFQELLDYRYHLPAEIGALRSGKDFLRMARDLRIFLAGRYLNRRQLLKDPFAVFSLPWFAERLNCELIVTVRHPAGFASSLKRLNWSFDFRDLLNQPLLMRDRLEPFRSLMQASKEDDIIGQASLLWTMIYWSVRDACERMPAVRIVRHEDLSSDPVTGFHRLYDEMGLKFTPRVEQGILKSSSSENPKELSRKNVHSVRLDSRANLHNWKHRLSQEEIGRIRKMTEEIAHNYYPEVDWD